MLDTADRPTAPLDGLNVGQGIYVYVEDVDAHFAQAQAGSARIACPPENTEWSFGSYRPDTPGGSKTLRKHKRLRKANLGFDNLHIYV